jgi:hypothetical protein
MKAWKDTLSGSWRREMSYKRLNPVPEEEMDGKDEAIVPVHETEMLRTRYLGHHTICQTLRDIYHLTDNPEIKLKLRLASAMSKHMQAKLKWYRENAKF